MLTKNLNIAFENGSKISQLIRSNETWSYRIVLAANDLAKRLNLKNHSDPKVTTMIRPAAVRLP